MRLVYKYGDAVFAREGMWQIMRLRARLYHSFGYEKILVRSRRRDEIKGRNGEDERGETILSCSNLRYYRDE